MIITNILQIFSDVLLYFVTIKMTIISINYILLNFVFPSYPINYDSSNNIKSISNCIISLIQNAVLIYNLIDLSPDHVMNSRDYEIICFCIAYFLVHIVYDSMSKLFIAHHICACMILFSILIVDTMIYDLSHIFGLIEISTIFHNLYIITKTLYISYNKIHINKSDDFVGTHITFSNNKLTYVTLILLKMSFIVSFIISRTIFLTMSSYRISYEFYFGKMSYESCNNYLDIIPCDESFENTKISILHFQIINSMVAVIINLAWSYMIILKIYKMIVKKIVRFNK